VATVLRVREAADLAVSRPVTPVTAAPAGPGYLFACRRTLTGAIQEPNAMTRKLIATFAAIAAFAVCAPAFAGETVTHEGRYTQKSVEISRAGYDLNTPGGAERFAQVLERAAKRVCDTGDSRSLAARRTAQVCVVQTMRTTLATIDSPYLTASLRVDTGAPVMLASR
jgi:UrcA family protein